MKEMFSMAGKVAIVTGGNGGIGRSIARGFAGMGSDLVIAARDPEKTSRAVKDLEEEFGVRVLGLQVDVREEDQIKAAVRRVKEAFGRIDVLVNNAGVNIRRMPQEYTEEEWDVVLETNLRGPFLLCREVYPVMKQGGGGKIINVGSMTSIMAGAKLAPYGASKAAIVQMTWTLAVAWAPDNIQVNAILPGWIDTELTVKARQDIEGLNEHVVSRTPTGRWGKPDELAGTAVFLATASSNFVTGVSVAVDGGYSIAL
jgi:2-deoxy-D-gluconate 3-dehydrogenase